MDPVPLHVGHVCGVPTDPVPWQVSQVSSRVICNFLTDPRTASQNPISIWYSRSPPGSCSGSAATPPRRPPKNCPNRSRKLEPPPACPPKSNPPKSKFTFEPSPDSACGP